MITISAMRKLHTEAHEQQDARYLRDKGSEKTSIFSVKFLSLCPLHHQHPLPVAPVGAALNPRPLKSRQPPHKITRKTSTQNNSKATKKKETAASALEYRHPRSPDVRATRSRSQRFSRPHQCRQPTFAVKVSVYLTGLIQLASSIASQSTVS